MPRVFLVTHHPSCTTQLVSGDQVLPTMAEDAIAGKLYDKWYTQDDGGLYAHYQRMLKGRIESDTYFCLLWANRIRRTDPTLPVGAAIVHRQDNDGILDIYVLPEYRRQGFGEILIESLQVYYPCMKASFTSESKGLFEKLGVESYAASFPRSKENSRHATTVRRHHRRVT